jgi:hypothetical protein
MALKHRLQTDTPRQKAVMNVQTRNIVTIALIGAVVGSLLACQGGGLIPRPDKAGAASDLPPTRTPKPTFTITPTFTPAPTATPTGTPTATPTPTASPTLTPSPTITSTATNTPLPRRPTSTPPPDTPTPQPTLDGAQFLDENGYHLGYGVQVADAKDASIAVAGGFTWAKYDMNLYSGNYLYNADNLLNALQEAGVQHVLLKVYNSPGDRPDAPRSGGELSEFTSRLAELASHIREEHGSRFKAIAYEIWNEPNLNWEWEDNPSPAEFTALLKASYAVIQANHPGAITVSGSCSPGGDYDDLKFLNDMYANGVKGYMDAVGAHPYGGPYSYDAPDGKGLPFFRRAELQRQVMVQNGDAGTPIWATEFSWLARIAGCDYGEHNPWTVTAQQQADYLVGAFEYADKNWPWMGPMFVVYDYGAVGRYSKCWPPYGYSILRDDESSVNLVSPAAAALFAMPKHSAW